MEALLSQVGGKVDVMKVYFDTCRVVGLPVADAFAGASDLRKFLFRGRSAHVFREVARANPLQEIVDICTIYSGTISDPGTHSPFCLHVAEAFSVSHNLRELLVTSFDSVDADEFHEKLDEVQECATTTT